jgi:hypothetical protein
LNVHRPMEPQISPIGTNFFGGQFFA